ncbi:MAG: LicD family protein [Lachnospiraceae bacterium]|nr:LicD family protein [Lachnospiraceae bacterium]
MVTDASFLRDEVRNGFYIPTAIKQAWAAELTVLSEIDRICRKYQITYFADWGTLLGTVRHGGFIPWDDDLDICMLRADYDRFRAVAGEELPKEYVIHDYKQQKDHWLFLARVVNHSHICFDEEHLKQFHNFPWLANVDIFLLDYLYPEEEKERERSQEILRLIAVADGIRSGGIQKDALLGQLKEFKARYSVSLPPFTDKEEDKRALAVALYALAEKQMARVRSEESDRVGQIFPWVLKGDKGHPKRYYEKAIRLPFENTTMPVPACYNRLLSSHYGQYLTIHKVWGGHGYPFFEGQKASFEEAAGVSLPAFSFDPAMLRPREKRKENALKTIAAECLALLEENQQKLFAGMHEISEEEAAQILADCQQTAIDLGTLIEQVKGEERDSTKKAVKALENFCEALYHCAQKIGTDAFADALSALSQSSEQAEETIRENVIRRPEVLFLPVGATEWKAFSDIYAQKAKEDLDIFIVPLPLLPKDIYGQVTGASVQSADAVCQKGYEKELPLTDWQRYDPSLHCPDVIYIQNPYDGENPCLTVPPAFYAKELKSFTERLVYIPIHDTAEFKEEDSSDQYNLRHYVTAPGVIYADEVILQSENIREQYLKKLTLFAGEETREHWQKTLRVKPVKTETDRIHGSGKKRLFYCISIHELSEQGERLIGAVRERFRVFSENREAIDVTLCFFPGDRQLWQDIDVKLSEKLFREAAVAAESAIVTLVQAGRDEAAHMAAESDAYYGSASLFVPAFMEAKKPVMIANYELL